MATWSLVDSFINYSGAVYNKDFACDNVKLYGYTNAGSPDVQSWDPTNGQVTTSWPFTRNVVNQGLQIFKNELYMMTQGQYELSDPAVLLSQYVRKYSGGSWSTVGYSTDPISGVPYNNYNTFSSTANQIFYTLDYASGSPSPFNNLEHYSSSGSSWTSGFNPIPPDAWGLTGSYELYYPWGGNAAGAHTNHPRDDFYRVFYGPSAAGNPLGLFKWNDAGGWAEVVSYTSNYVSSPPTGQYIHKLNNKDALWAELWSGGDWQYSTNGTVWASPATVRTPVPTLNHDFTFGQSGTNLYLFDVDAGNFGTAEDATGIGTVVFTFSIADYAYAMDDSGQIYGRDEILPITPVVTKTYYKGLNLDVEAGGDTVYIASINMDTSYPEVLSLVVDFNSETVLEVSYQPDAGDDIRVICGDTAADKVWAGGNFGDDYLVRKDGSVWYVDEPPSSYFLGKVQGMTLVRGNADNLLINTPYSDELFISYFTSGSESASWSKLADIVFDVKSAAVWDMNEELYLGVDNDDPYWLLGYWYSHIIFSQDYGINFFDISLGEPLSSNSVTSIIPGKTK